MGRYDVSNTYEDDDEPPFWVKGLLVLVLCAAVTLLVKCAG